MRGEDEWPDRFSILKLALAKAIYCGLSASL